MVRPLPGSDLVQLVLLAAEVASTGRALAVVYEHRGDLSVPDGAAQLSKEGMLLPEAKWLASLATNTLGEGSLGGGGV